MALDQRRQLEAEAEPEGPADGAPANGNGSERVAAQWLAHLTGEPELDSFVVLTSDGLAAPFPYEDDLEGTQRLIAAMRKLRPRRTGRRRAPRT
jgi:hypothetical protein